MKQGYFLKALDILEENRKQRDEVTFESPIGDQADTEVDVAAEVEAFVNRPEPVQRPRKASQQAPSGGFPTAQTPFAKAAGFSLPGSYRT